jgi:hypothetical protein
MMGRRTAAMLCVLLTHALFFLAWHLEGIDFRAFEVSEPPMQLIFLDLPPEEEELELDPRPRTISPPTDRPPPLPAPVAPAKTPAAGESSAITTRPFIDWPVKARESAARVLEREREAERLAKMFAGPDGTWASLTKRQRSQLNKFKWAPGVDGLKYDDKGNAIYTLPNGCSIVNFMFFGCPLGKSKVHDDMFDNMRLYFDEQRLPQTNEGNGTEPEALRPTR